MATYRIWRTGAGAIDVELKALRPFIMYPSLELLENGQSTPIILHPTNGIFKGSLTDEQVQRLIASPTSAGAPFLFAIVNALFKPGASDRTWQWGISFKRGDTVLPCFNENGVQQTADTNGFIRSSVRTFPVGKVAGADTWIISLS